MLDPEIGPYPPRLRRKLVVDPEMGPYPPRKRRQLDVGQLSRLLDPLAAATQQSAISHCGSGFHIVGGGIDPETLRFLSPRCNSCRELERILMRGWEMMLCGHGGPRRWPERQLSPRAGSRSLNQLAITR